jgi:hypothetical protein
VDQEIRSAGPRDKKSEAEPGRERIQAVTKGKQRDASDSVDRLGPALGERKRVGHYAKTSKADSCREDKAVLPHTATKSDGPKKHRHDQPDLVNDRFSKKSARRGKQADENGSRSAVDETKARNRHRDAVKMTRRRWS